MDSISLVITKLNKCIKVMEPQSGGQDVGTLTRRAQTLTKNWQQSVIKENDFYLEEVKVNENANFRIDLIDTKNKIAFELKVSPKNVGHELYKDVMKVLLFNDNCTEEKDKIKTFVFITHGSAPEMTAVWHFHLISFLEKQGIKFHFENY